MAKQARRTGMPQPTDSEPRTRPPRARRVHPFTGGLVLGSIVTVAVVLLVVQNRDSVRLNWLAFHFQAPLWMMLILTAVAGAIIVEVLRIAMHRARRKRAEQAAADATGVWSPSQPPESPESSRGR